MEDVKTLQIYPKIIESDHCPFRMTLSTKFEPDLRTVEECSRNFKTHDHYDINRKIPKTINLSRVDITTLYTDLETLAVELQNDLNEGGSNDLICNKLTNNLYSMCKKNYKTRNVTQHGDATGIEHFDNCTSQNLRAIAEANFECFQYHLSESQDQAKIKFYKERWLDYEKIAITKENEEHNTRVNKKWSNHSKDAKELWRMIDWKSSVQEDNENELSYQEIYTFFTNIFQSKKTIHSPKITDIKEKLMEHNVAIPITDRDIDMEEISKACKNIGNGIGMDGLPPEIAKILPPSIKEIMLKLFQNIFTGEYPEMWENQLLFATKKKGHTVNIPKLRGIGLSTILSRMYDDIIDQRFSLWYTSNLEQAAKKGQGCVFQIFGLLLLLDFAKEMKKTIFIGLLDYEKAYDFANRAILIEDLLGKGIGKRLAVAIYNMYSNTSYTPKISNNLIGKPIVTEYGVTQGRKSSGNFYAFSISDIPKSVHNNEPKDFMDPYCIAQLADDTSLTSESHKSTKNKFQKVIGCSDKKHQHVNTDKTKYMHMSEEPITAPIVLEDGRKIDAVERNGGYDFIGFRLTYTDDIYKLIESNLNSKMFNVAKFYAWLEYNNHTPFCIKIKVLYSCMFASLLYSGEAWGSLSKIEQKLLSIERKALKSCLGVKSGTSNELVYQEINQADIIATIKDRQYKFAEKIKNVGKGAALVKEIWDICVIQGKPTGLRRYYEEMKDKNQETNINERKMKIENSEESMCTRYKTICGTETCSILYQHYMDDTKRKTVTRWRLSSHKLKIETGRYSRPYTKRDDRLCKVCNVIEDESHAIYDCKAHNIIRENYKHLINLKHRNIKQILNPTNTTDATNLASFLDEIEDNMKELEMI